MQSSTRGSFTDSILPAEAAISEDEDVGTPDLLASERSRLAFPSSGMVKHGSAPSPLQDERACRKGRAAFSVSVGVFAAVLVLLCAPAAIAALRGYGPSTAEPEVAVPLAVIEAARESAADDSEDEGVFYVAPLAAEVPEGVGKPLASDILEYLTNRDAATRLVDALHSLRGYTDGDGTKVSAPVTTVRVLKALLPSGLVVSSREELLQVTGFDMADDDILTAYADKYDRVPASALDEVAGILGQARDALARFDDAFFEEHDLMTITISVNSNGAAFAGAVTDGETLYFCFAHEPRPAIEQLIQRYQEEAFAIPKSFGGYEMGIISWTR